MTEVKTGQVPGVEVAEAMALLEGDAQLIDVRDAKEWAAGHVRHSVHVPMDHLSNSTTFMSRMHRVVVASRSGRRAAEAVVHLRTAGIDAVRLEGGLHAWQATGGELISDNDRPPRVI